MNIYGLIPLIAILAYIPLFVTIIGSRPWQRQHRLFALFLIAAIMWSLCDLLLRADLLRQYDLILAKLIIIMFTWTAVQFHCFATSFFLPGQKTWRPLAYAALVAVIVLAALNYIPESINTTDNKLYPVYGSGLVFMLIPLLVLAARNVYLFRKRLKILDNPVLYNQIVALVLTIFVLTFFAIATFLPWGREFPITHLGNIINAFILSYATIRHQLVDIRIVLRQGLTWVILGIIGIASYWILLAILHLAFHFELDMNTMFAGSAVAIVIAILIYRLRSFFFVTMGKALQGQIYDYRQRLSAFASEIHNVFSLKEQGRELLRLITNAIGCSKAGLLFLELGSKDFTVRLIEPADNPLPNLRLEGHNPIVEYLGRERKPLTRESLSILPEFSSLWNLEKKEFQSTEIELFMPLISRDQLVGILVLDKKKSGRYTLEDIQLLEEITKQVAVSMEKEYLREQLWQREEELSVVNRSSTIITSSLDIQRIYDSFIIELKKIVDVNWAAIVLIEENELYFMALSSEIGSAWQAGERIPIKNTATEWIALHKKPVIEPDLTQEIKFATGKYHLQQGLRSIIYLPLIVKNEVIGGLIVGSRQPNAYAQRHVKLLEQLASQIAMPVENSRLYAKAEEKARIDELTGLLNRRSLDEMIVSEIGRHSRYGGVFSLIILDLDSFKSYNDIYGHLAGDKLLKQIGGIMKQAIRSADQAFRYGGDEFAILLPQTAIQAAYQVAERTRKQVALGLKSGYMPVTTSLGMASWPADGIGPNELIAAADKALYNAKRIGGNQSHRASGAMLVSDDAVTDSGSNENSEVLSTIYALAATVDARDHYTRSHSKKVNEYAMALADALKLEPLERSRVSTCAFLHDIGKIGISDEILNKTGKLTAEEWEAIYLHPQLGATIAGHARQLAPCIDGILYHHERYDGSGYPRGLKGEEIPLEARILAIADAYAAMTSDRHYSDALSYEQALEEIKQGAGRQFDPNLVKVFLSLVEPDHVTATREK